MKHAFILGIDVASRKLDLCLLDVKSQKQFYWTIENNLSDLEKFMADNLPAINSEECLVGMESTGDYHLLAARFFLKKNYSVKLINPILTKQYTRTTIRGSKTDKKDSELICKLILDDHGDRLTLEKISNERKNSLRLASSLTKTATQLKHQVSSLKRKSAVLNNAESNAEEVQEVINKIESLSKKLVTDIGKSRTKEEEFIDSIPGFAIKLSAVVYEEIGDINRFKNSKSLVAFAGLDPKIKQSGEMKHVTGKITKRGSAHLRTALYLASNVARRFDLDLNKYYEKKKTEKRTHKEIMTMISRKLLARIYTVLKEQRNYIIKNI